MVSSVDALQLVPIVLLSLAAGRLAGIRDGRSLALTLHSRATFGGLGVAGRRRRRQADRFGDRLEPLSEVAINVDVVEPCGQVDGAAAGTQGATDDRALQRGRPQRQLRRRPRRLALTRAAGDAGWYAAAECRGSAWPHAPIVCASPRATKRLSLIHI